jgi:hypothetical protein
MSDILLVILAPFAAYRIALAISRDVITERARSWVGRKAANTLMYSFWWYAAELVFCQICTGFWASGIIIIILYNLMPMTLLEAFLLWLVVAGEQALIAKIMMFMEE